MDRSQSGGGVKKKHGSYHSGHRIEQIGSSKKLVIGQTILDICLTYFFFLIVGLIHIYLRLLTVVVKIISASSKNLAKQSDRHSH